MRSFRRRSSPYIVLEFPLSDQTTRFSRNIAHISFILHSHEFSNCYTSFMNQAPGITWNSKLRLAISDVDETIAEVYTPAEPAMITELSLFLSDGKKLFMVTGGSLKRVREDITNFIDPALRHNILISHCSGAEVWGFTENGELQNKPFYSIYSETFTAEMKARWRKAVSQLVKEFRLRTHPAQPKTDFWGKVGRDPRDIMLDDRGPQITMELVNGHDLPAEQMALFSQEIPLTHDGRRDLRIPLMQRAGELFTEMNIPISPRLGGVFALDFAIKGSSKTTSIKYVLENPNALAAIGLKSEDLTSSSYFEVWGDKYSILRGGTDRHMSEALPATVRSIDFREEDPIEFPEGYNIVLWDGQQYLHHGLLEYLQSQKHGASVWKTLTSAIFAGMNIRKTLIECRVRNLRHSDNEVMSHVFGTCLGLSHLKDREIF